MLLFGNITLNTIFFPVIATLLMKALGFIESIQMRESKRADHTADRDYDLLFL